MTDKSDDLWRLAYRRLSSHIASAHYEEPMLFENSDLAAQARAEIAAEKDISPRADLLREAERIVDGDRDAQYGNTRENFGRTAALWSAYLGVEITAEDYAAMMALVKVSRIRYSPEHRDSWVDLAGYAACGWHCVAPEKEVEPEEDIEDDVEEKIFDYTALTDEEIREYKKTFLDKYITRRGRCPQDPDGLHFYQGRYCVYCGASDGFADPYENLVRVVETGGTSITADDSEDHDLFRKED